MDKNIFDILEVVNFIKGKMVTKDELPDLVRPIIREEVRVVVRKKVGPSMPHSSTSTVASTYSKSTMRT